MKTSALLAAAVAVVSLLPARANAQQMTLHIENGLVTLDARNVSVRQILAEWARIGGTRIVNGEKVVGNPVTLQLTGVPEKHALDTILRGVSGYMLASRQEGSVGTSAFDRILILPTSSAPRTAAVPANATFVPRPMPVQQQPPEPVETEVVQDDDHDEGEGDPDAVDGSEDPDPPEAAPPPPFQRRPFPNPMGPQGQPIVPQGQFPGAAPMQDDEDAPVKQQPTTVPLNVPPGASSTPGVIAPVPQQQDPQTPSPRVTRPPPV